MRFSKRLQAICDMVRQGESVADIGTDHGYVPLMLYEKGISGRVIMCDISESSLDKARGNFRDHDVEPDESDFRLGDGIDELGNGEVDDIIIAGLGGNLIVGILDADMTKTRSFKKYILQPRNNSGELRHFLFTHGFDIVDEVLVGEGKFVCEIIAAVTSPETVRAESYPADDIRWKYPETFVMCDRKLLAKRLDWKFGSIDEGIRSLRRSRDDNSEKIERLKKEKSYLEELLRKSERRTGEQ